MYGLMVALSSGNVSPGVENCRSFGATIDRRSISFCENALIDMGTLCSLSARRWAVTPTSSSAPRSSAAPTFCPGELDCASAAPGIEDAQLRIMVQSRALFCDESHFLVECITLPLFTDCPLIFLRIVPRSYQVDLL